MAAIPKPITIITATGRTVNIIPRMRLFFAIRGSLSLMQAHAIMPPINEKNIGSNHHAALGFPLCLGYCGGGCSDIVVVVVH